MHLFLVASSYYYGAARLATETCSHRLCRGAAVELGAAAQHVGAPALRSIWDDRVPGNGKQYLR